MRGIILRLLIIVSFMLPATGYGQTAASYNFTVMSATFTNISGTGIATTAISSGLDATVTGLPIGFPFTFCGTSYSNLAAGNHGFLYLTNTLVTPFTNTPGNVPGPGFLMAFWDDIAGGGNTAYYQTTGTTPNRVFTFQWTNWQPNPPPWTSGTGQATFQIKLYEGSNIIDFCYGPNTMTGMTGTIGIANSTTDYKTVDAGGLTATGGAWYGAHTGVPASGTVYRWYLCPVSITASNDGPTCPGGTINLLGTTTGTTYSWTGPGAYTSASLTSSLTGVTSAMAGTYTLTAGNGTCTVSATTNVSVISPPTITITPATTATVCLGSGATFTASGGSSATSILSQNFNSGLGSWTINNIAGTATSYWQIRTSPGYGGIGGDGTPMMEAAPDATGPGVLTNTKVSTPSFSTVGYSSVNLAFNQYCFSSTTYDATVMVEYSIDGGATWATLINQLGVITGATTWSAATPTTSVPLPAAAICQSNVKIRWNYVSTWGFYWAIDNVNITGTPTTSTYAWTGTGGGISCASCATTTITPTTTGTHIYSLTSTVCGCGVPSTVTVNVTPPPTAISGTMATCTGLTTTLTNATAGGTWTSSNPAVASVGASSGVVSGVGPGTATITYTMAAGCAAFATVTVYTMPGPITGTAVLCQGATTTLSNSAAGGTWSSNNTAVATIGASTGVVSGVSAGTAVITYTFGGSCYSTQVVTVNPLPAAIVGTTFSMCVGQTITLTDPTPGGIWQSSAPITASVGLTTGIVTGNSAGTATISYRVAGCSATAVVTVVGTPTVTATTVCVGQTTTMTGTPAGGTWVGSCPAIATIGLSSGILGGVSAGTCLVTYAIGTGCTATGVMTVQPLPAAIGGTLSVCPGTTATVTNATPGGTWSITSGTGTATIGSSTGVITGGVTPGTATVSYTIPTGCFSTAIVTINPLPSFIIGSYAMCAGSTTTFTDGTPGGTWSSSAPGIVGIGSSTGIATAGAVAGTSTISYILTATGCYTTASVTVNPLPAVIGGTLTACPGTCTTLTDATPGGTWSISPTSVATIDAAGVTCGVSAGTATVTYTAGGTGCMRTAVVTVSTPPSAITGTAAVCVGFTTSLSSATPGGTWSSSSAAIASVASTGVVTGNAVGTATISYIVGGCFTTVVVTVNAGPGAISGTASVCVGQTTTLTSSSPGGAWSSSLPSIATVDAVTGVVTGVAPGTTTITTSLGSGCNSSIVVTVTPLPSPITGTTSVCVGLCNTLADASAGGTWSISPAGIATIVSGTGVYCGVSAGTATVTYLTGCPITTVITVNPLPAATTGTLTVCSGQTTTLSNATAGGTWSTASAIASVGASTGIVTGGTVTVATTATITYTLPTGCIRTTTITVNPLPTAITSSTGTLAVCVGSTIILTGTPGGGTWTSSTTGVATIGSSTGVVTGVAAGTTTITYTITSTGCFLTAVVTVNPLPAAISGTLTVCPGLTTTLSSATAGGIWTSGNLSIATVGSSSGIVTGASNGLVTITYTLPTGCRTTAVVTVNALPGALTGTASVCEGQNTTLSSTTAGGTWSVTGGTGTATVLSVPPSSGAVTGGTAGTATVTYTNSTTGCYVTRVVTVVANPAAIGGTLVVCAGSTSSLTNTTAGGAWISGNPSVATINPSTGVMTGATPGTAVITYTMSSGCYSTAIATVTTAPSNITGTMAVCEGSTTTLVSTPAGGVWTSSDPSVATVGSSGDVTGISAAGPTTATITYSLGTGCIKTATVTVNVSPAPISGSLGICVGTTTTLADATPGGSWSSSAPGTATVSTSGVVLGINPGTATISYSMPSGCARWVVVTVNSLPAAITGTMTVCQGLTTALSSTTIGGTWSSSNTAVATVNPATGVVTGVVTGVSTSATATITYSLGTGCITTATVTVLPLPAAISGTLAVCTGLTTTLSDATAGGSWSSSNAAVASVGLATGIVSGLSTTYATATITYTLASTGCYNTAEVTVNPLPAPITGVSGFCNLTTTTLSDATPGGTWSSSDPAVAYFPSSLSGALTGSTPGAMTVTYTLPTGCITTKNINIILAPYPIGGSPEVCEGSCTTLNNTITGGTWTSSNSAVAPISTPGGVVCGVSAGTTNITYELSNGCYSEWVETVNPTPGAITGTPEVCVGLTTALGNSLAGGGWISSDPSVATVDPATGIVTGVTPGTTIVSYSMATGCYATVIVTVDPLPSPVTGTAEVCVGLTTTLSNATPGGAWSSSNTFVASVSAGTGIVSGVSPGTATITYTLPTGCISTIEVTVNPLPSAITGTLIVCQGATSTLSNISAGGAWSSSDPSIASINALGVVDAISAGTATITYTLLTGCIATEVFTVNPVPTAIGGSLTVCAGFMSNLTNTIPGGIWSMSGSTMVATIHPLTGVVTGITPGTITVTYTLGTGCAASAVVTVNPLPPAITGVAAVCEASTTTLADAVTGGTWTSSDASIASVDPALGVVTGNTAGNATITYTISTGCINIRHVTVNPLPAVISGASQVCEHFTTTLSSTPAGEAWTSSNTVIASVGLTSGVVTGLAAGTTNISYTIVATGCTRIHTMTVNPTPAPITGSSYICIGQVSSLSDTYPGGSWSSSNTTVATIGSATGVANGLSFGSSVITYMLPVTGCYVTKSVTVSPLPNVYNMDTTTKHYCAGGTGVYIDLTGSQIGVSYAIYYGGTSATGYVIGTGSPISFGPLTVAGIYTVLATNATTGCTRNMTGSAMVVVDPLITPTVNVLTLSGTDTVCSGGPRLFTAETTTGGTAPTFTWKVNGLTVGSGSTYTFIPADGDVVSITMHSSLACASPATITGSRTLKVLPEVTPFVSVLADPGDTICQFTLANYTASPGYGGGSPTYTWMVNGGVAGSGPTFAYEPDHNDVVTVQMISNYVCSINDTVTSTAVVMAVDSMIVPHVVISATPGLMVTPGQTVTLNTTVTHAGVNPTYQWKVNGVPVPGATNASYTSTFNHYDSVTCMVTSDGWCRDITTFDWVFITVAPLGVHTANLGGDLMLLPNPNKGEFTIRGTLGSIADQELTAEITNMLGQVVHRSKVMSKQGRVEERIQLDNTLANGMYILNLRSESASKVFHFVLEQ